MEKHQMEFNEPQYDLRTEMKLDKQKAEQRLTLNPNTYKSRLIIDRLKRVIPYIVGSIILFILNKYIPSDKNKFFNILHYIDIASALLLLIRAVLIVIGIVK